MPKIKLNGTWVKTTWMKGLEEVAFPVGVSSVPENEEITIKSDTLIVTCRGDLYFMYEYTNEFAV